MSFLAVVAKKQAAACRGLRAAASSVSVSRSGFLPASIESRPNNVDGRLECPRFFSSNSFGGGNRGSGGWKPRGPRSTDQERKQFRNRGDPAGKNPHISNLKPNFDRTVLQPAQRGELTQKHASGIPKLAGRAKHRPNLGTQASNSPLPPGVGRGNFIETSVEEEELLGDENFLKVGGDWQSRIGARTRREAATASSFGSSQDTDDDSDDEDNKLDLLEYGDEYFAPELINDDKYYWREEDHERLVEDFDIEEFRDEDGYFHVAFNEADVTPRRTNESFRDTFNALSSNEDEEDSDVDEADGKGRARLDRRSTSADWKTKDPERMYFLGHSDLMEIATMKDDVFPDKVEPENIPKYMEVLPLADHGPNLDGFLSAMLEHPTKYARIEHHDCPGTRREPLPRFPKHRANPPLEFVEKYRRFLFVTGLPPLKVNGEFGDLNIPAHRLHLQKTIARLVGVNPEQVFAVNTHSGFVGFNSPRDLADTLAKGPSERILRQPPSISKYTPSGEEGEFGNDTPDRVVVLTNMPLGNTSASLAETLFPKETDVGRAYKGLAPADIHFKSKTTVLVRFASKEQAESALTSKLVEARLKELGEYRVRYFRARRELIHAGFSGPGRTIENRKMGPRLFCDGDMPSKTFFITHFGCLHLRNLDPSITKEDLSVAFQPFSTMRRDIHGSVEIVTCSDGLPTGQAYIGFDLHGEAEECMRSCGGSLRIKDRLATMTLVRERKIPGKTHVLERRPERSVDELIDDLQNWERFVDPADIEHLEKHGVSKVILDEALRAIRYNNPTFGPLDNALRHEALRPEKGRAELYKEMVQAYIEALKQCIATPDNVGALYEEIHFPGEEIDLSIFEREKARQKELMRKRAEYRTNL